MLFILSMNLWKNRRCSVAEILIGIHRKTSKGGRMCENVETAQNHNLSLDTKGMIIAAMLGVMDPALGEEEIYQVF